MTGSQAADRTPGDGLSVHGGTGGTAAHLADLETVAEMLIRLGGELGDAAARVLAVGTDPVLVASCVLAPATGAQVELAVAGALAGRHGILACAAGAGALGVAVRAAVAGYRGADAMVAAVLRELEVTAGLMIGDLLLTAVAGGAGALFAVDSVAGLVGGPYAAQHVSVASGDAGERLLELLGRHRGLGDAVAATAPGVLGAALGPAGYPALPGDQRGAVQRLITMAAWTPWLKESGRVRLAPSAGRVGRAPAGVADIMRRTASLSPGRGAAPGTVRVERVVGPDGARAWIVHVPGTQNWSPRAGDNPFDLTSGVTALGGRRAAVGALVTQALRSCGAAPGEPVLLSGHSLGGLTATELAADPRLRGGVSITHVISAGSPTGLSDIANQVRVLSLEHSQDPAPWLDGRPNPDRPQWVTVRRAVAQAGESHEMTHYVRTAAMVDASPDPSLVRWRGGLTAFLDRPGAVSTSWEITGERIGAR